MISRVIITHPSWWGEVEIWDFRIQGVMAEGVGCRVGRFSDLGVKESRCYSVGCRVYGDEGHHVDFQGHHNPPHLLFGGGVGRGVWFQGSRCRVYGLWLRVQGLWVRV